MQTWKNRSIVSLKDVSRADADSIYAVAKLMQKHVEKNGGLDLLKHKILAAIFYEPSTRTSSSFQAAMLRLGGQVIKISATTSSVKKGESLEDTVRSMESYSDVIVLRHPEMGSAQRAASVLSAPLLNAGDGPGSHPTQALLDGYCILAEQGRIDGLTVTLVGDLKFGRTTHSLVELLSHYRVKLNYVSPDFLQMPKKYKDFVQERGLEQNEYTSIQDCLAETDILYVTRIQKERFTDMEQYEKANSMYRISPELLKEHKAKPTMRIMHPLPRLEEISSEVDSDPRAAYFRQMRYGLYTRMALIALVLGADEKLANYKL